MDVKLTEIINNPVDDGLRAATFFAGLINRHPVSRAMRLRSKKNLREKSPIVPVSLAIFVFAHSLAQVKLYKNY